MIELPHISHSQIKTWRQCEQQWDYKSGQKLVPRRTERKLRIGSWAHACLEGHYRDGDWRIAHAEYTKAYRNLFEEERLMLDDGPEPLPRQVARIMRSYKWYRRNEGWKVIAVEQDFEVPITVTLLHSIGIPTPPMPPIDHPLWLFKGRIDLIIEDPDGLLWVVDHKTTDKIPDQGAFHAMEPQLILYPWAAEVALGIKTAGVIYNYLRSSPPTKPKLNKDGSVSATKILTDYPTAATFLRENGRDLADYSDYLLPLKADSPYLARYFLPREQAVTQRILAETATTARAIIEHSEVTRNVTLQCEWCPYKQLCRAELFGLDTHLMRERDFVRETEHAGAVSEQEVANGQ